MMMKKVNVKDLRTKDPNQENYQQDKIIIGRDLNVNIM